MKKNQTSLDNVNLHSKRLVSLWQHDHFKNKGFKHVDGVFICSNIFSVYVYSTSKNESVIKALATRVDNKISDLIGDTRQYIRQEQRKLDRMATTSIISNFVKPDSIEIAINRDKITPNVLALIKLFIAVDNHIITANKAKLDGDISSTECSAYQSHAFKKINVLLTEIKKICSQFHQIRKNQ